MAEARGFRTPLVMVAAVMRWLEEHPRWLVILDNVEDAAQGQKRMPLRGSGHVLLTMRAQPLGGFVHRSLLEPLPLDEATRFLLRRANLLPLHEPLTETSAHQQTQARAIAEALGGLPLALDQAGAYIDEAQCSLKSYLDLYEKQRAALLRRRGTNVIGHEEPVAATWKLAFLRFSASGGDSRRPLPRRGKGIDACLATHRKRCHPVERSYCFSAALLANRAPG
jgi:hypothetical protein